MATTKYGGWVSYNDTPLFSVAMEYEITTNADTTATIKVTSKIRYGAAPMWPVGLSNTLTLKTSVGGSEATTTHTISYNPSKRGTTETLNTRSVTISKTHAAQSVAVSAVLTATLMPSTPLTSSASGTQSVTAKTSYKVTYDANGGNSNSLPAAQTKWHGESLTLSNTVPVCDGCTFLGWNTKNDGSGTHYASGGTYTGNAALKLYAVWMGVSVETISALRCDSGGTESDEGAYGHVDATWRAVGTIAGTVAVTARYKDGSWSSVTLTGDTSKSKAKRSESSGSVASTFGGAFDTDTTYQVQVTATMTYTYNGISGSVTATASAYVPYAYITMDFRKGGHGVALGKTAVRDGFDVAMKPIYFAEPPRHDTDSDTTTMADFFVPDGCTVSSCHAVRWGKHAAVAIAYKLSTALSVPDSGNVTDVTLGTLKEGWRPALGMNACMDPHYGLTGDVDSSGVVKIRGANSRGAAYTIGTGTTLYARIPLLLA